MVMKFNPNNRLFASETNNMALQLNFAVRNGCTVTESSPVALTVDVASGDYIFNGISVTFAGVTDLVITAADPSLDRIDLVVLDSGGTASVIIGTPAATPQTPTYDAETFLCLARVFVDDGATTIVNADITDQRILNTGTTGGGGGLATFTEVFSGQTSVSVNHNLDDAQPVVQAYDNNGEQITPNTIDIIDSNNVTVTFSVSTSGHITVHGGDPAVIGITAFKKFGFSGTSVTINHALGTRNVGLTVYDNSDFVIEPQSIEAISDDEITLTFASSTTGTVSVTGGSQSPSDGVGRFQDTFTSVTTKTVTHNLNDSQPVVMVYDSTDEQIFPDVTVINANVVQLDFASAETGKVTVVGGIFVGGTSAGNLLPTVDDTFDIGSGTFRWKDIHISGNFFIGLLATDPVGLVEGQIWYNTTDSQLKLFNGTSTVILG